MGEYLVLCRSLFIISFSSLKILPKTSNLFPTLDNDISRIYCSIDRRDLFYYCSHPNSIRSNSYPPSIDKHNSFLLVLFTDFLSFSIYPYSRFACTRDFRSRISKPIPGNTLCVRPMHIIFPTRIEIDQKHLFAHLKSTDPIHIIPSDLDYLDFSCCRNLFWDPSRS